MLQELHEQIHKTFEWCPIMCFINLKGYHVEGEKAFGDACNEIFGLLLQEIGAHSHLHNWRLIWLSSCLPLVKAISPRSADRVIVKVMLHSSLKIMVAEFN